jgi:hypothetical protein
MEQLCCTGGKNGHDADCWRKKVSASSAQMRAEAAILVLEGLLGQMEQVNGSVEFYVSELVLREALAQARITREHERSIVYA